jgi:hypothetical protein
MSKGPELDFSAFMPILILTIGCLVVLLVTNTIIIVSNPENVRITSVVRSALYIEGGSGMEGGAPFPFGNKNKEPAYVDVYRNRLVLYPGGEILPVRDLQLPGNPFEKLLETVEQDKDEYYVVLLVRPHAASVARRLRKAIRSRDIDFGWELFETERPVDYNDVRATIGGFE